LSSLSKRRKREDRLGRKGAKVQAVTWKGEFDVRSELIDIVVLGWPLGEKSSLFEQREVIRQAYKSVERPIGQLGQLGSSGRGPKGGWESGTAAGTRQRTEPLSKVWDVREKFLFGEVREDIGSSSLVNGDGDVVDFVMRASGVLGVLDGGAGEVALLVEGEGGSHRKGDPGVDGRWDILRLKREAGCVEIVILFRARLRSLFVWGMWPGYLFVHLLAQKFLRIDGSA
jgi:hypothetical protein